MNGETLNDLFKPVDMGWKEFTVATLEAALRVKRSVLFDLTHVLSLADVLDEIGPHAAATTGHELRYLRDNWARFRFNTVFYENGIVREPPW